MRVCSIGLLIAVVLASFNIGDFEVSDILNSTSFTYLLALFGLVCFTVNGYTTIFLAVGGVVRNWRKDDTYDFVLSWSFISFPMALLSSVALSQIGTYSKIHVIPLTCLLVTMLTVVMVELRKIIDECNNRKRRSMRSMNCWGSNNMFKLLRKNSTC